MKLSLFSFFISAIIMASCNSSSKKTVPGTPANIENPHTLSDTLQVHITVTRKEEYDRAYIGGVIENLSDGMMYKDPVIRFTSVANSDTGAITKIIGEACPVHIEIAPKAMMTFISDCFLLKKEIDADSAVHKEYYGQVIEVERKVRQ